MARGRRSLFRELARSAIACLALTICRLPAEARPPRPKVAESLLVEIVIEGRGTVRIEVLPNVAPKTSLHFLNLVDKQFYSAILFHRVEDRFVAQAGDPASKKVDGKKIADISPSEVTQRYRLGLGGSGRTVPLEAVIPCVRGSVGLAHNMSPDSGDSQFFFNLSDNHRLDNQYTIFARVVSGMDVVDHIRQGDRIRTVKRVLQRRDRSAR